MSISGTLTIDENAQLRIGASATLTVNSSGVLNIVGTNSVNPATITRNVSGTYAISISGNID